jgi:hypothetical protein
MAKITRAPTVNIKPPPGVMKPPVSKTQDNYTHHTSPVKGPQAVPPEVNAISSKPKVTIQKLPDAPMAKYKHDDSGNF